MFDSIKCKRRDVYNSFMPIVTFRRQLHLTTCTQKFLQNFFPFGSDFLNYWAHNFFLDFTKELRNLLHVECSTFVIVDFSKHAG